MSRTKKESEFTLYIYMYDSYELKDFKIYYNDSLLYSGHLKMMDEFDHMFISNLHKCGLSKFRLKSGIRDTTFVLSTLNIDSLLIGFYDPNGFGLFDNHTKEGWLFE